MKKREFSGELKYLPPSRLFKKDVNTPVADFFLVLGLVYNDLKGILLFQKLLVETYRKPANGEVSVHSGEIGGLHVQLTRLLVGVVHEFFEFIEKNEDVLLTAEFNDVLDATNSSIKAAWYDIVVIACNHSGEKSEFAYNLMLIRHNISFHYHQSGKELRHAFLNFFQRNKVGVNEKAFYRVENDILETRFFYADAAAEEYMRMKSNRRDKFESMSGYSPEMMDIIRKMNFTISRLLKVYLKKLPKDISE